MMQADKRFAEQKPEFWAYVRAISEGSFSDQGLVKVYNHVDIVAALLKRELETTQVERNGKPTRLSADLHEYFSYRARILNEVAFPNLMDFEEAEALFFKLKDEHAPTWAFTRNKQKGEKAKYSYLTGIVNILVEARSEGLPYDHNPQRLTSITRRGFPVATLARRVDGCFPSTTNPIAILEVKEYYHSKTYGSRVNGALVETLLDGMQINELKRRESSIDVRHLLIADARNTLWGQGRPLLCRFVDALHEGYVDEVLFGREVVQRLPDAVSDWVAAYKARDEKDQQAL